MRVRTCARALCVEIRRAAATCSRKPVCAPAPARARSPCVATRARHQSRVPLAWPGGISLALTFHLKVAYLGRATCGRQSSPTRSPIAWTLSCALARSPSLSLRLLGEHGRAPLLHLDSAVRGSFGGSRFKRIRLRGISLATLSRYGLMDGYQYILLHASGRWSHSLPR